MPTTPPEEAPSLDRSRLRRRLRALEAWPPEYEARPGQRPLRRFSAITWTQAMWPDFIKLFTGTVPADFWTIEEEMAVVACPCGAEPQVEQNQLAICDGEECGRVFLRLGEEIKVAKFDPAELAESAGKM